MSNILFHNKYHHTTHHTVSSRGLPDSASDPIASPQHPFLGVFYNRITNESLYEYIVTQSGEYINTFDLIDLTVFVNTILNFPQFIDTNSAEWNSTFTTLCALSADFSLYNSVYSTVNALSSNWQSGSQFGVLLAANSARFISTVTTVSALSTTWNNYLYKHLTNLAQQDTQAKNFAMTVLQPSDAVTWQLPANQVATVRLSTSANFLNVGSSDKKRGGKYILIVKQPTTSFNNCTFDTDYVFAASGAPVQTPTSWVSAAPINQEKGGVTVLKFLCDGNKMYATSEFYSLSGLKPYTYVADSSIILTPEPLEAVEGDNLQPLSGIIVTGTIPYSSALDGSINIEG